MSELKELTREFFKYLDYTEESDSGNIFHPIYISCCRVMMNEPLNKLLDRMKELAFEEDDKIN
jgi:hypothetical protein